MLSVGCEQWTEPVPPQPNRFVAEVDSALEKQVIHIPQRQRKPDIHEYDKPDHLGRRDYGDRDYGITVTGAKTP